MTPARLAVASAAIAAVLAGSAAAIVSGRELWPFSPYPMFAGYRSGPTFSGTWLAGVRADGAGEVPLRSGRSIEPFGFRMKTVLRRIAQGPDGAARLERALADVLARYEAGRRAGRHDGPALKGIRLYFAEWDYDPAARNLDRPRSLRFVGASPP